MDFEVLGRVLKRCLLVLMLIMTTELALGSRVIIFDVRKSLPMSAKDPVYHDYFINAGTEVGLKVGAVVTVSRRIPLHDPMQNRSQGDLEIPVAKLHVIHVQNNLAVARFHEAMDRSLLPSLEYDGVMTGDRIELDSMETSFKKPKTGVSTEPKEGVSQVMPAKPRETASVNVAPSIDMVVASPQVEPSPEVVQADLKSDIH